MIRTQQQFNDAFKDAMWLSKYHKKSFWIIPTNTTYVVSCFNQKSNLPQGTNTLEVNYEDEMEQSKVIGS